MKIVLLLGAESEPICWFANQIQSTGNVVLAVVEQQSSSKNVPLENRKRVGLIEKTLSYLLFKLKQQNQKKLEYEYSSKYKLACEEIFESNFSNLNGSLEVLKCNNINDKEVEEKIKSIQPDLILDHGTSLVKPTILSHAKLALNLHWGLSPYYRGVDCTIRALLNWDPYNIGVTIHKLAVEIDGGDILAQKRVEIKSKDDTERINLKLTKEGTVLCLQIIEKLKNNEELIFKHQIPEFGFLVRGLQWNAEQYEWAKNLSELEMERMLAKPSRKAAPIIELN